MRSSEHTIFTAECDFLCVAYEADKMKYEPDTCIHLISIRWFYLQ